MKKLIALLLALTMVLSMAACGNTNADPTEGTKEPAAPTTEATVAPTEPALNNTLVEYYMQKANEVVVTDTHVTFTDDSGRGEITVEKNPENAAVLYGSLACLWYGRRRFPSADRWQEFHHPVQRADRPRYHQGRRRDHCV